MDVEHEDELLWEPSEPAPPLTRKQRRLRLAAGLGMVGLLVAGLVISTVRDTVPAGGSGTMSGMDMSEGQDHIGIALTDVEGRKLELPGGRPGAVMFMATQGCEACSKSAGTLSAVAGRAPAKPAVTLVSVDTEETRSDFERFDRTVGGIDVRYALDDASGSIAKQFRARELGTIVVYDRQGMVTGRLDPNTPRLNRALERAFRSQAEK